MNVSKQRLLLIVCLSILMSAAGVSPSLSQTGQLPAARYDKLIPGVAGPQANDNSGDSIAIMPASPALSPINMSKGDARDKSADLIRSGVISDAKKRGLMPLSLRESKEEIDKKLDSLLATERAEMADLWEATLSNSPDIQFVIERLVPTSNAIHATTILSRMLSTAIVGAMGTLNMVAPSPGTTAITQSGGSILSGLLGAQDRKDLRKAQISEAEMIILYKIVRDTADKLVENYRVYKRTVAAFQRATIDLEEFKGMAADLHGSPDPIKLMGAEYILRRQQMDIAGIRYDLRQYRQQIVDLAGSAAADSLDKRIEEEYNQTELALPTGATPWDEWNRQAQPGS